MEVLMSVSTSRSISKLVFEIVSSLSSKYGFSVEEGMSHFGGLGEGEERELSKSEMGLERKVIMPWCGKICSEKCKAVRLNHGLYTQCVNEIKEKDLCKTCMSQSLKRIDGSPPYGLIKERLLMGSEYVDPKGKRPLKYGNVMIKLDINREDAEIEAARQGVKIAEEDYIVEKGNRGRPKKSIIKEGSNQISQSNEKKDDALKKKRGRPKKNKEIIEVKTVPLEEDTPEQEDKQVSKHLSKQLSATDATDATVATNATNAIKETLEEEEIEEEEEEEEEEEVEVKEFTFNKKLYYRNPINNALYDPKSYEHIGIWDEENETIVNIENEDED